LPRANNSQKKKKEKFSRRRRTAAVEASQNLFFFFLFTHLQLMDFLVYFLLLLLHVWPAAHLNLGQLLGKQGRYDEAIHWLAACTQLDSSASVRDPQSHRHSQIQALILWGQMELAVRQQPARAVQLYKQALRRSPTNPQQLEVLHQKIQFNFLGIEAVKPYNIK
jgi:tetratricopeptide (TPR) repeat protein